MSTPPSKETQKTTFDDLVHRNVEAITRIEQAFHENRSRSDRISDAVASFCGSPKFVYIHCAIFACWLIWNGAHFALIGLKFDPPPFNLLNLAVSLEAMFLSAFILTSQNRQQRAADQRNHLDLQINMLAEQESSQMLIMMKQVMDHLGIEGNTDETDALQEITDPERLAEHIQETLKIGEDKPDSDSGPS